MELNHQPPKTGEPARRRSTAELSSLDAWWSERDLNPQPSDLKTAALPIELPDRSCQRTSALRVTPLLVLAQCVGPKATGS